MLLAFRTGNFRSLRDEVELLLTVPTGVDVNGQVETLVPGAKAKRVGTVLAIYGPNASGKSNVLGALYAMGQAVANSHQRWPPDGGAPHDPFLLNDEHEKMPSLFEVDLLLDGERWQYGFRLNRQGITQEWLYSFPRARRRVWFEREEDTFHFGKTLVGPLTKLRELTRRNSLFLSVGAANNHSELGRIARWFTSQLSYASRQDHDMRVRLTTQRLSDGRLGDNIQKLLNLADLGIARAERQSKPVDAETRSKLLRVMEVLSPEGQIDESALAVIDNLGLEVSLLHFAGRRQVPLALARESGGTQTWFGLVGDVASALAFGHTLLIDELDSSLHPHVAAQLVRLFHDPKTNKAGAQLIFSTHDTSLLSNLVPGAPLRRDEFWFTEKDEEGATRLYPLTDFRPRKHENLERGYLQGRYGAVPVLPIELELETVSD